MKLNELKIIVTGSGGGMGFHFAKRLAEAGAQVTAGDIKEEGLQELPDSVHKIKLDVSDEQEVINFVNTAHEKMGGLNALVNNAGVLHDGLLVKKDKRTGEVKKLSMEQWHKVLKVNLTGATMMVREVVAKMIETETKPGVIVNISSISRYGNYGQSNYVAAKAAMASNTLTWAHEFGKHGIRVGAIAPGMVITPMTDGMHEKAREALIKKIPVGRIGVPEDLWRAVQFVLECDYYTGRCVDVDGGMSML